MKKSRTYDYIKLTAILKKVVQFKERKKIHRVRESRVLLVDLYIHVDMYRSMIGGNVNCVS